MKRLTNYQRVFTNRSSSKGFTLLEVIFSLAIVAIGLIPVMSMMTIGLNTLNSVMKEGTMTQIEQQVRTSLEKSTATELTNLSTQGPQSLYFDLQGVQLQNSTGSL